MKQGMTAFGCALLMGAAAAMLTVPHSIAGTNATGPVALNGGGVCPGSGDCFVSNGTPGCDDAVCCNTICAIDAFCCDVEWDQICADQAIEACAGAPTCPPPACSKINVECLNGVNPGAYANSKHVGRLANGGAGFCTAWIVAGPNIVMTNEHCVGGITPGVTTVQFNYECADCPGTSTKSIDEYVVTEVVFSHVGLDFAILKLAGNPAETWGVARVNDSPTTVGQKIYEIHHGEAKRKGYDDGQVTTPPAPNLCIPGTTSEIGVDVIATGGASGSPIFDACNHSVVAICHCGPPCAPGWGIPMADIWPIAEPHILGAGGTPNVYCAGDLDHSGTVGIRDLLQLLSDWDPCNIVGLLELLSRWGPC